MKKKYSWYEVCFLRNPRKVKVRLEISGIHRNHKQMTLPSFDKNSIKEKVQICQFVCLFGFLTSSSTNRLYRGRAPRQSAWQFYVLPHMRQSWSNLSKITSVHTDNIKKCLHRISLNSQYCPNTVTVKRFIAEPKIVFSLVISASLLTLFYSRLRFRRQLEHSCFDYFIEESLEKQFVP